MMIITFSGLPPECGLAVKLVDKFTGSAGQLESWIAHVIVLQTHEAEAAEASFLQIMRSRLTGSARSVIDACVTIEAAYTALRERFAIQLLSLCFHLNYIINVALEGKFGQNSQLRSNFAFKSCVTPTAVPNVI